MYDVKASSDWLKSTAFIKDTYSAHTVLPADVCADTSTDWLLSMHKMASR